ncbi:MAG: hypothetical protein V7637_3636 [Mycobacteriales bacterium]
MTERFNPPPGWPTPPAGWTPPSGWNPDPSWPAPPPDWPLWIEDVPEPVEQPSTVDELPEPPAEPAPPDDRPDLLARIADLEARLAAGRSTSDSPADDARALQDVGIYRYNHPLENAAAYREALADLDRRIAEFTRSGNAVTGADMFTLDGSLAKGRRMLADLSKLMLRAYNAEAENCVRSMRAGNLARAQQRLDRAVATIEKLGAMMQLRVNPDYHALRLREFELTADHQMKVQEERELAREERERLREQSRVEQELAAERQRLDKERAHYAAALVSLRDQGDHTAADDLSQRLDDIDKAIADNDYRAANIRAGYVYVISNIGAFGPGVVKIGLTRRLEPLDRVRELGDASVPFPYDVHALFFSDDAVTLETELHRAFAERRLNLVNPRREFFFATPAEVRELLLAKTGGMLEFTEQPEALQYLQSCGSWPDSHIRAERILAS